MIDSPWLLRLAGLSPRREVARARYAHAALEHELRAALDQDDDRLRAEMRVRGASPHLQLGAMDQAPYLLGLDDLDGLFAWVTAGTGSGKSRLVGGALAQLVALAEAGAPVSVIVVDLKGETADLILRSATEMAQRLPPARRETFLRRAITVRFFDGPYLPEWQLLQPHPSVSPAVQAHATAETLEATVAADLGL